MGSSEETKIPDEAKQILLTIASNWDDVIDPNALHVVPLKGAMTNQVYQIKWPTNQNSSSRKVLVRIYGKGVAVFFDRNNEIRTFEFMSKQGQGAHFCTYDEVTLSACDLRDPEISTIIATKLKEFHDLDMPGPKDICLWNRLYNWLNAAKSMCSPQEIQEFQLDTLQDEISILEKAFSGNHQHIGFCHNDLQYGNIMIHEETRSITIIDYEYASYNPIAFDIANHFCEMAADYHTETPHTLDYSKYPDLEERQRFIRTYLSCSGGQPSLSEVEQLVEEVEKYTLANHIFWGLWGIISEHVNEIDFDYSEYARQRFSQYRLRKPELLGSSGMDAETTH
ncbi:hypothetical protein Leryth_025082 [Lithospermum erythrorhizon]|nr:hypothetical protein Leryth_025082 [Lithospermum erythrorhizon]